MPSLDARLHLFARPDRRASLTHCFQDIVGCGPPDTLRVPGAARTILLFRFPEGGAISIEFINTADDSDGPRLGTWMQITVNREANVPERVRDAGYECLQHDDHDFFFVAPGGQVLSVVEA